MFANTVPWDWNTFGGYSSAKSECASNQISAVFSSQGATDNVSNVIL